MSNVTLVTRNNLEGLNRHVRFGKASKAGFVMEGIHKTLIEKYCSRLFILGAKMYEVFETGEYYHIRFSIPEELVWNLACAFPARNEARRLKFSDTRKVPLYGFMSEFSKNWQATEKEIDNA